MTPNYLWILNYENGAAMVIKLNKAEIEESNKYYDFEAFISECLADKYNFNLSDCCWMITENYDYERYGF